MFAFELLNCVAFNLSPVTSISTISIWAVTIGIRSGISVVSVVSISISLWLSISRSLSVVTIGIRSGISVVSVVSISLWLSISRSLSVVCTIGIWVSSIGISGITGVWGISVGSVKESRSSTDDHKSKLEHVVYLSSIFRLPM